MVKGQVLWFDDVKGYGVPIMNEVTKYGVKCESTVLKAVDDGLATLETKWYLQVTKTLSDSVFSMY